MLINGLMKIILLMKLVVFIKLEDTQTDYNVLQKSSVKIVNQVQVALPKKTTKFTVLMNMDH